CPLPPLSSPTRRSSDLDDPIPMNDGCLRPVEPIVPPDSMLDPAPPAAVVAGNVETSQVVTEAILAATGRLAPGQGTMNNFTFGRSGEHTSELQSREKLV